MLTLETIRFVFEIIGILQIVIWLIKLIISFIAWILGILPLFKRFGFSRWYRKIDIVANSESYGRLRDDLLDTGIFRKTNINWIPSNSITKVADSSLLLIDYNSVSAEDIKNILSYKKAEAGCVFYFPEFDPPKKTIPIEIMKEINNHPFTIVVNCRGRLINDILTTMLSTGYDKKRV